MVIAHNNILIMKKQVVLLLIALTIFSCNDDDQEIACDNGTYIGDVFLTTQQEVDDFGALCYSKIEGDLSINLQAGFEITDLSALISLKHVTEMVHIVAPKLETLHGLENLHTVNSISFVFMYDLISLNALENLSNVGHFGLQYSNLTSLEGLGSITSLNGLMLSHNPNLSSISALGNVSNSTWEGRIDITRCPLLTSLEALSFLTRIDGRIVFVENDGLTSLNGLHNITSLYFLLISGCNGLTSLEGLNSLESVINPLGTSTESVRIDSNMLLQSVDGLDNLIQVKGLYLGFNGASNPQLSNFCALQNLFVNGSYLSNAIGISHNAYNPSIQDIIDGNCSQ